MLAARVAYVLLAVCCSARSDEFAASTATCYPPDWTTDDGAALHLLQKTATLSRSVSSQQVKPSQENVEKQIVREADLIEQLKAKDEMLTFLKTSNAYWHDRALSGGSEDGSHDLKPLQKTVEGDSQQAKRSHLSVLDVLRTSKHMKAGDGGNNGVKGGSKPSGNYLCINEGNHLATDAKAKEYFFTECVHVYGYEPALCSGLADNVFEKYKRDESGPWKPDGDVCTEIDSLLRADAARRLQLGLNGVVASPPTAPWNAMLQRSTLSHSGSASTSFDKVLLGKGRCRGSKCGR